MYATCTNYQQSSAASFNPCEDIPVLESDDVIPEMVKIKRPAPARRKSGEVSSVEDVKYFLESLYLNVYLQSMIPLFPVK